MIPEKCRILVAFPYLTRQVAEALAAAGDDVELVVDSGAFTSWNTGKVVLLRDYCEALRTLTPKPWRYFNLDVIGDPEASDRNYQTMLDQGFKPVPVLTRGGTEQDINKMFETSDVVAVGGLTALRGNQKIGYIKRVVRWAAGRNLHLLGAAGTDVIAAARPYMCDSSSWVTGHAFSGTVEIHTGGLTLATLGKGQTIGGKIAASLRRLGADPSSVAKTDWAKSGRVDPKLGLSLRGVSARSQVSRSAYAARHGVRLFAACGGAREVGYIVDAWRWYNGLHKTA